MSDPLNITADERGVVRVFTTDLEPEGNAAITTGNVGRLLGRDLDLDPSKVEVFPARMVESLGLAGYLAEGYGIRAEALAGKAAALDALNGLVILVRSTAFRGKPANLDPNPAIRFIGTFEEEQSTPPGRMSRHEGNEATPLTKTAPRETAVSQAKGSWIIVLAALVIAAALVLFAVF